MITDNEELIKSLQPGDMILCNVCSAKDDKKFLMFLQEKAYDERMPGLGWRWRFLWIGETQFVDQHAMLSESWFEKHLELIVAKL
jgi:hypothetical protein